MNKKKGFSLIEIIGVIAIIAILSAIAIPNIVSVIHKSERVAIKQDAEIIYTKLVEGVNDGIISKELFDTSYVWADINVLDTLENGFINGHKLMMNSPLNIIPANLEKGSLLKVKDLKVIINMPLNSIPLKDGKLNTDKFLKEYN